MAAGLYQIITLNQFQTEKAQISFRIVPNENDLGAKPTSITANTSANDRKSATQIVTSDMITAPTTLGSDQVRKDGVTVLN